MREKRKIFPMFYIILVLFLLFFPIMIMVVFSFNDSTSMSSWEGFTFRWYQKLFTRTDIMNALINSIWVSIPSTIISVVFALLGAIGFYKFDFKGKSALDSFLYLPAIVPAVLLGIALLSFYNIVGITLSRVTIMLAHITFCTPFAFTTIKGVMGSFDQSIEEAARDLGCNQIQAIAKVIAPNIMPGIISAALLTFTISFEDVLTSFFVAGPGDSTLSMQIFAMIKQGVQPDLNALSAIMIFVAIVLGVSSQIFAAGGFKKKRAN